MRNIVSAYVDKFLHDRRERLKFGGIVLLLAVIVVGIVFWRLSYVGVAMTNEVYCGMEEHQHDNSCYTETLSCGLEESAGSAGHTHDSSCYETVTELVCGLEESAGHAHDLSCYDETGNLVCGIAESEGHVHDSSCYTTTLVLICGQEEAPAVAGHTHSSSCYTRVLTCAVPEHTHSMECMIDETADLETAKDWELTLPEEEDYTGVWAEDVVLVAESQIGYTESEKNFVLDEDGETRRGYTRYGEWYGNAYGDWDAMFVSFCLYYAGVTEEAFPYNAGAYAWIAELNRLEEEDETEELLLCADREEYFPVPGDIIFFDTDGDKKADHVGIVEEIAETEAEEKPGKNSDEETDIRIITIEGDYDGGVCENEYDPDDEVIIGYGILPENPNPPEEEDAGNEIFITSDSASAGNVASTEEMDTGDVNETGVISTVTPFNGTGDAEETGETEAVDAEEPSDEIEEEPVSSDEKEKSEEETASEETEGTEDADASGELEPEDTYLITYSSNIPEALEVEGPDSAEAGEDLYFIVTVENGYEIAEAVVNDEAVDPEDISVSDDGNVTIYSYLLTDVEENTVVFLDATQVLKGHGSIKAYEIDSKNEEAEFILEITDAPTNTKISLDSPTITVKDIYDRLKNDVSLDGNLYYVEEESNEIDEDSIRVAYLMLSDNIEDEGSTEDDPVYVEGEFEVSAYDADGNCLTDGEGHLVLNYLGTDRVEVWNIQTNTLCYLDKDEEYQQEIISAVTAFDSLVYVLDDWQEGAVADMGKLTETKENGVNEYRFFYGTASTDENKCSLTEFTEGIVYDGRLVPYVDDGTGQKVPVTESVTLYMEYDEVYSFDVVVSNAVNELTEDNGDTYLWVGDTFYIDQYHNQGNYLRGYAYKYTGGFGYYDIWVKLGIIREENIENGVTSFEDYNKVITYSDLLKPEAESSASHIFSENNNITSNATDREDHYYGILGPYKFENDESAVTTTTVRVTGRVGESFTASEVFGTDFVYMINKNSTYIDTWMDVGAHSTDNGGGRAWWYWIKDVYQLNNYEDICEYVQIYEDENTDQIRLRADEIGNNENAENESGVLYDVWDLVGIYTKRESAVQSYMIENRETLEDPEGKGLGFVDYPNWPMHIQLRLTNTVEVVVNGVVYNGTLTVMTDDGYKPTISYNIAYGYGDINGDGVDEKVENIVEQNKQLSMNSNGMESGYVNIGRDNYDDDLDVSVYIPEEIAFNNEYVKITVKVYATGTLTGTDGSTIVYDGENPLEYEYTLTSEQLKEAWDCCPCHNGYDIAVNLGQAVRLDADKEIILYKVWDDSNNYAGARDDITSVYVSLQRSKGGESEDKEEWDWKDVVDEYDRVRYFEISGDATESIWSTKLNSYDLDLTYIDENGDEQDYYFRINDEQEIQVKEGYGYEISYDYQIDGEQLIIENFMEEFPITIAGVKVWDYEGNEEIYLDPTLIPDSVTIALYQDDEEFLVMTDLTEGEDKTWSFVFENVPQGLKRTRNEDGSYEYEYLHTYTLYELDPYGNIVGNGEVVPLDLGSYRVDIVLGSSKDQYGNELDPNEDGSITGNTESIKITNRFLVWPVTIYKYTEGENDLVLTYSGWASGVEYEAVAEGNEEPETIPYYLWGIKDPDPEAESEVTDSPVLVKVTSNDDSDGLYKYSEFIFEPDEDLEARALAASPDGTILIENLPDGYTYYLTTDGGDFDEAEAIELTLALDGASGAQPLSGAEFIISKTVISSSDATDDEDEDDGGNGGEAGDDSDSDEPAGSEQTLYAVFDENGKLEKWTEDIDEATRITSGEDGYINIKLTTGTYTLTEVKAPSGFNLLIDSIEFEVTSTGATLALPVENPPGVALPVTGGIGTFRFTLAGLTVAAAAGGALVYESKKRKGGRQA